MSSVQAWTGKHGRLNLRLLKGRVSARSVTACIDALTRTQRVYVMVHAEELRSFDWDAAARLVSDDFVSRVGAVAFVVGASRDARDALQLFTHFHPPAYPWRVFDGVQQADRWLTIMELGVAARARSKGGVSKFPRPAAAG